MSKHYYWFPYPPRRPGARKLPRRVKKQMKAIAARAMRIPVSSVRFDLAWEGRA